MANRQRSLESGLALLLTLALTGSSWAQVPSMMKIGVAGGVKGPVQAYASGNKRIGRVLTSGQPLYLNDKISTGPDGSLQVMLIDETVFTIGPNSSMVLDEFVYDPSQGSGKVSAKVTKGVFRFVTGQIGHNNPSDMKVKFPSGTMGIRGTIVAGVVSPQGTTAVLLGPGPANNAPGERVGAFSMDNAGARVDVLKPGYATTVAPGQAPTAPALMPQGTLTSILQQVAHAPAGGARVAKAAGSPAQAAPAPAPAAPSDDSGSAAPAPAASTDNSGPAAPAPAPAASGDDSGSAAPAPAASTDDKGSTDQTGGTTGATASGDASSASSDGGQNTASASGDLSNTQSVADLAAVVSDANDTANADINNLDALIATSQATWDDLRAIPSGTGQWQGTGDFYLTQCNGGACDSAATQVMNGNHVALTLNVDFGAQTIGGQPAGLSQSAVVVSAIDSHLAGPISETATLNALDFSNLGGLTGPAVLAGASPSGNMTHTTTILNNVFANGPADAAGVKAIYNNGLGTTGSGTLVAPRVDCSVPLACH